MNKYRYFPFSPWVKGLVEPCEIKEGGDERKEWEKKWVKKLVRLMCKYDGAWSLSDGFYNEIEAFISSLLAEQKKEIREKVEGKILKCGECGKPFAEEDRECEGDGICSNCSFQICKDYSGTNCTWDDIGYNQALEDILNLLKK